ncbi:hypothetical protein [Ureaplasma zalophigenitalium]|uniref:HMA domain-containing protein n=1 Tax=Ureaplasma zalophigenitalium TaxID=907723 RepID=A0ABT3BNT3_9BACT|nr:hypothetical protein [Ureaplasma zalophigenitalium]MCV3753838.1 hypothetical protein [Ureaplasma zalophigenitalium]
MTYIKLSSNNLNCGSCLHSLQGILDNKHYQDININLLDRTFSFHFDELAEQKETVLTDIKKSGFDNVVLEEFVY